MVRRQAKGSSLSAGLHAFDRNRDPPDSQCVQSLLTTTIEQIQGDGRIFTGFEPGWCLIEACGRRFLAFCSCCSASACGRKLRLLIRRKWVPIQRVKTLSISSLDRSLPKVRLEFFLKYEGEGAPIKWEVNDCGEQTRDTPVDHGRDSAMCVQAEIGLTDGRAATVLISVGTLKRGPVDVPSVYGARVTYPGGTIRRLDRLSDLPVELHRPLPKGPKDLPPPVSARLSLSSR